MTRLLEMLDEVRASSEAAVIFTQYRKLGDLLIPVLQERLGEFDGRFDSDILFQIEDNSRLSVFYVAELMKNFKNQPAFVYASYNGGPSNVARWLEAKAKGPTPLGLDDYIEEIVFDETRRYNKRVLETQAAYELMYEQKLPEWDDAVDAGVLHTIEF